MISKSFLKKVQAVIDLGRDEITCRRFGCVLPLVTGASGHYLLTLFADPGARAKPRGDEEHQVSSDLAILVATTSKPRGSTIRQEKHGADSVRDRGATTASECDEVAPTLAHEGKKQTLPTMAAKPPEKKEGENRKRRNRTSSTIRGTTSSTR